MENNECHAWDCPRHVTGRTGGQGCRRKSNLLPPNESFSDHGGLTSCAEVRMHFVYYSLALMQKTGNYRSHGDPRKTAGCEICSAKKRGGEEGRGKVE